MFIQVKMSISQIHYHSSIHIIQDRLGNTILHILVPTNNMDLVATLLQRGAKAKLENKAGLLPVHFAVSDGMKAMLKFAPQVH